MAVWTEGAGKRGMSPLLLLSLLLFGTTLAQEIREPPVIKGPTTSQVYFRGAATEFDVKCDASGNPPPVYSWFWNSKNVPNDVAVDKKTGTLSIPRLSILNEGMYYCQAKNTFSNGQEAVAQSPVIEIRVGRVEPWNWNKTAPIPEVTLTAGSYGTLKCDDKPKFYGPASFKWYSVVTAAGKDTQTELALGSRRFVDEEGTLHFAYVDKDRDEKDNTYYACVLSSVLASAEFIGKKKKLKVEGSGVTPTTPLFQYSTPAAKRVGKIGDTVRLECIFSGFPVPTVEWKFLGKTITSGRNYTRERFGRYLEIRNLKETDDGIYTCIGSNGANQDTKELSLNVTSPPIWVKQLQSQTVPEGENAVFHCLTRPAAGENPSWPPTWYRNMEKLTDPDPKKYAISEDQTQLTIMDVRKDSDIACYQCRVGNSVGESFSDGCLNVILPIRILSRPEEEQEVKGGENVIVNLTVTATTDQLMLPYLSYRWFFKGKEFKEPNHPEHITYDAKTKQAFINTTGFTNEQLEEISGVYSRYVFHNYQTEVVNITVTNADLPVIVPVQAAGFDYWIIGLILGILLIIIVIIIICCVICRRKMLEGDYPVDRKETAAGLDPEKELKDSGFHDLSRADYDFLPEKKSPNFDLDDDQIPLGDDESFGSAEYGEEATAFNEDGSFIGQYSKGKRAGGPPAYNAAESRSAESNV